MSPSQEFQPIQLLKDISDAGNTGHLQISANSVTWELYLVQGKLQYAYHSLQSVDTIKHYLLRLNLGTVAKIAPTLAQDVPNNQQLISIADQLVNRNYLSASQRTVLIRELTQDALESFLWLTNSKSHWNPTNPLISLNGAGENLLELSTLLKSLQIKLHAWQKLGPLITSPHQRPLCVNPLLLQQKVPSGNLSPATLQQLVKLM